MPRTLTTPLHPKINRLYWIATALVAALATFSGIGALLLPALMASYAHLGYPNYFRIELGLAKLLGVALLLLPVPPRLKEWVYAGFSINFVSAGIAHAAVGDPLSSIGLPLVGLGLLLTSYVAYHRRRRPQT